MNKAWDVWRLQCGCRAVQDTILWNSKKWCIDLATVMCLYSPSPDTFASDHRWQTYLIVDVYILVLLSTEVVYKIFIVAAGKQHLRHSWFLVSLFLFLRLLWWDGKHNKFKVVYFLKMERLIFILIFTTLDHELIFFYIAVWDVIVIGLCSQLYFYIVIC